MRENYILAESGQERCVALIRAYMDAPPDKVIDIAAAKSGEDAATATEPAVMIRILGTVHGFTADEALLADIFEGASKKFPTWPETSTFDAFAKVIRAVAAKARALAMN
jgi:hypothetical protein